MVAVIFVLLAWFGVFVFLALPKKLPLAVNLLLFMAIDIIMTNKLTIVGYDLGLFRINTASVPHFLSLILHNDFTVPFALLAFVNAWLTTGSRAVRRTVAAAAFLYQLLVGALLRRTGVLYDDRWNYAAESAMILAVMLCVLALGWTFRRMAAREGWVR